MTTTQELREEEYEQELRKEEYEQELRKEEQREAENRIMEEHFRKHPHG